MLNRLLTVALAVAALALATAPSHSGRISAAQSEAVAHVFVPTTVDLPEREAELAPTF